ncbi:dephospho-CoA kinase [Bacteroides caecigallinarum]|uniref:dephospho-CoA kinase n=1 Tax=Bacteroides caecigallinarum TaxID=1411144 RepID=UPI001957CDB2|nr:dephospho-CoA kinase [Bacteroides caecigallinarum]MBM6882733.1 dephospho-CoA kinase [Bacteroides caecigallinarum]MBM6888726.1 dephospho-CoA kinase [Bacteroides caecigallinarum]MCF2553164.1 dephospho-CoA kinase [Bacteroides caecigallinarum]
MNNNRLIKIGVTGGIGSGKSFLSSMLKERGIPVFDSDTEAKKLMLTDVFIISSLKSLLGEDVYTGGKLNKPLLASYIFSSADNAAKINSIVHPRVKKAFLSWADERFSGGDRVVAIESAILFESGFSDVVDKIVTVVAPIDVRVSRVMSRDSTTRDKVMERINSQMGDDEKISKSDFIIENDGRKPLNEQIDVMLSVL